MINLIHKELKEFFLNKNIIILIVVSICFMIGTYYVSSNSVQEEQTPNLLIGIVDEDNSNYSQMLVNYFTNSEAFSKYAKVVNGQRDETERRFYTGEIEAYLVIPSGFVDSLIHIENTQIEAKISSKDTTTAIVIKNVLKSYEKFISSVQVNTVGLYDIMEQSQMSEQILNQVNTKISIDLVMVALNRTDFFELHEVEEIPKTSIVLYYFLGIISVLILYIGLIPGFRYAKERRIGTLDRLRIIGNSVFEYIITQLLLYTFLFGAVICMLLKGSEVFTNQKASLTTYVVIIAFVFLSNALGLFLATLCNNSKIFLVAGNLLYLFSCILGGIIIPIMFLPDSFVFLARGTMHYWFIKLMAKIQHDYPNSEIYRVVLIIVCLALVITFFASYVASNTARKEIGETYE